MRLSASSSVPLWLGCCDDPRENRSQLWRARYDGNRLSVFRRRLTAILIATGTPVVVFERSGDPGIRRLLTILAIVWLAMFLPMIRLLCLEWQNRRLIESLQALVYGQEES